MSNLSTTYLFIISVLGAGYALYKKETRTSLALAIIGVSFVMLNFTVGSTFWLNLLSAGSLIVYLLGVVVLVLKKENQKTEDKTEVNDGN